MNNYNYMSIGRKLCKADDQNNTIAGLIITTLVLGGCIYLQHRLLNDLKSESLGFKQKMDDLNFRNNRQRQIIDDLQKTKQELMDELNSKDDKA